MIDPSDTTPTPPAKPVPSAAEADEQLDRHPSVVATATLREERHSGPLPHPVILAAYEEIMPGAAERIFKMAERQSVHRQELETSYHAGANGRSWAGLFIGGALAGGGMWLASLMVQNGEPGWGLALVLSETSVIAGSFLVGRGEQVVDLIGKAKRLLKKSHDDGEST